MNRLILHRIAWGAFAFAAIVHLAALWSGISGIAENTQPLFAPILLLALASGAHARGRTFFAAVVALVLSWGGDFMPRMLSGDSRIAAAGIFLAALTAYCIALAPLWWRTRDRYRMLLAIPYGGVVIGLFLACADSAGDMLPIAALYALVLATTAFFAAGVNSFTWMGGALFLMSSSILAMNWFLPGAWIPQSSFFVMLTYIAGQGFLVLGIVRALSQPEASRLPGGSTLVIVES